MTTQPERERTDEGLRAERRKLDGDSDARQSRVDLIAEDIVTRARARADAVLAHARSVVDATVPPNPEGQPRREALALARAAEDAVLADERAAANQRVRLERAESARLAGVLLPHERATTDRLLLTERARSDVALANRDDFLAMVAHDLRNLLNGIIASAAAVADEAPDSDEGRAVRTHTTRIERYGARMGRLVSDLVDVVSIDAGKLAMQVVRGDAARVITEAADAFTQAATDKGIFLESTVAGSLDAHFDHERMLQVVANLVTNALKFTPAGGRIAIRGERMGDAVHFAVTDSGVGIPEGMREAVFERFWQVGKHDHRGMGLGLYISKCIVIAHGGRIWAESTLGVGSTFHVTLPVSP